MLYYAWKYLNTTNDLWKKIVGRGKVLRKSNKELKFENMMPRVKHVGGSVIVQGSMSASSVGNIHYIEGTMNQSDAIFLNIIC